MAETELSGLSENCPDQRIASIDILSVMKKAYLVHAEITEITVPEIFFQIFRQVMAHISSVMRDFLPDDYASFVLNPDSSVFRQQFDRKNWECLHVPVHVQW